MDCRRPLSLALTLLAASAGCSQHSTTVRSGDDAAATTVTANSKSDTLDPEAQAATQARNVRSLRRFQRS